jgi:hypothetical protein
MTCKKRIFRRGRKNIGEKLEKEAVNKKTKRYTKRREYTRRLKERKYTEEGFIIA